MHWNMGGGREERKAGLMASFGLRHESSGVTEHVGQGLSLVYAHVLPEIVVTTEILPTSLDGTLVRCEQPSKSPTSQRKEKD